MRRIVEEAIARADDKDEAITLSPEEERELEEKNRELEQVLAGLTTNIKVVGCGGAGTNTIARCFEAKIYGAELIAINTDAQHLLYTKVPHKILIGKHITKGMGAGSLPEKGREAAMESESEIKKILEGSDIVFVTCGLGGGTGTGSAPVVSRVAKETGALTLSIVTLPFSVEGRVRKENAEMGLARLKDICDTVIVIPNDKLLEIAPRMPLNKAFKVADELLMRSIKGITEMITKPGLINLDFADLRTIMKHGGVAMIGLGESDSEERAIHAVNEALKSPLLDMDISEASGALVNVIGGEDMTIKEAEGVVEELYSRINPDATIIWGAGVDPTLEHKIKVMIVLTGVKSKQILGPSTEMEEKEYGIDMIR